MPTTARPTFTIDEAAEFLGVSLNRINELVREKTLQMWDLKGKKYFLPGQLDYCKLMLHPKLPAKIER